MNAPEPTKTVDDLSDIPSAFHSVVREHGRDLFAACMNTGIAMQAAAILAAFADKYQSRKAREAVEKLSYCYNQNINALVVVKGWSPADFAACDSAIREAFGKTIITPKNHIILDS